MPSHVAQVLEHMVGQLDLLTRTVGLMEARLALLETRGEHS